MDYYYRLFIYIFIYLITSTTWCRTHNRAELQFKCVVTEKSTQPRRGCPHHWGLRPLLFSNSGVGSFTFYKKCCETGPTVFRSYPRRLECLTVCRCHYKGSTFSSVIYILWVLARPGFEPTTSRSAAVVMRLWRPLGGSSFVNFCSFSCNFNILRYPFCWRVFLFVWYRPNLKYKDRFFIYPN